MYGCRRSLPARHHTADPSPTQITSAGWSWLEMDPLGRNGRLPEAVLKEQPFAGNA
jgi:hypothetical protein